MTTTSYFDLDRLEAAIFTLYFRSLKTAGIVAGAAANEGSKYLVPETSITKCFVSAMKEREDKETASVQSPLGRTVQLRNVLNDDDRIGGMWVEK
jgi:hypothetical protein